MKYKMTKELQRLIDRAQKKLDQAKDARDDVMYYLQDHYDIDIYGNYEAMEDECTWCYGINASGIQKLIEERNED